MNLMQGNTYALPIKLKMCGRYITPDDVDVVEFTFGNVVKNYPQHVSYSDGAFILPLSQEETFALAGMIKYQTRVLFKDGQVKSTPVQNGNVSVSISKVVLRNEPH